MADAEIGAPIGLSQIALAGLARPPSWPVR